MTAVLQHKHQIEDSIMIFITELTQQNQRKVSDNNNDTTAGADAGFDVRGAHNKISPSGARRKCFWGLNDQSYWNILLEWVQCR